MPAGPLSVFVTIFVLTFLIEMLAPAITAPVESETIPVTVPRSTCPHPGAASRAPIETIKTRRQSLSKTMYVPPAVPLPQVNHAPIFAIWTWASWLAALRLYQQSFILSSEQRTGNRGQGGQ